MVFFDDLYTKLVITPEVRKHRGNVMIMGYRFNFKNCSNRTRVETV